MRIIVLFTALVHIKFSAAANGGTKVLCVGEEENYSFETKVLLGNCDAILTKGLEFNIFKNSTASLRPSIWGIQRQKTDFVLLVVFAGNADDEVEDKFDVTEAVQKILMTIEEHKLDGLALKFVDIKNETFHEIIGKFLDSETPKSSGQLYLFTEGIPFWSSNLMKSILRTFDALITDLAHEEDYKLITVWDMYSLVPEIIGKTYPIIVPQVIEVTSDGESRTHPRTNIELGKLKFGQYKFDFTTDGIIRALRNDESVLIDTLSSMKRQAEFNTKQMRYPGLTTLLDQHAHSQEGAVFVYVSLLKTLYRSTHNMDTKTLIMEEKKRIQDYLNIDLDMEKVWSEALDTVNMKSTFSKSRELRSNLLTPERLGFKLPDIIIEESN